MAAQAHFGMQIGDDGENCRVVDERGQAVEAERLLALIAGSFAGPVMQWRRTAAADFPADARKPCDDRRRPGRPALVCRRSCRRARRPANLDALLVLLSRNDLAFSAVLDQESDRSV